MSEGTAPQRSRGPRGGPGTGDPVGQDGPRGSGRSQGRTGRRPKDIGTAGETAVVRFLQLNGWPHAERRALHGSADQGDITGTPFIVWEVKAGKQAHNPGPNLLAKWLAQTEQERINARADVGILVMARRGYGATRIGHWWAVIPLVVVDGTPILEGDHAWVTLSGMCRWLAQLGYGGPRP